MCKLSKFKDIDVIVSVILEKLAHNRPIPAKNEPLHSQNGRITAKNKDMKPTTPTPEEAFCSNCRFKKSCAIRIDYPVNTCDEHEFKNPQTMNTSEKLKFPAKFKITERQLIAIVNAADNLSGMIGCGEDHSDFIKTVKGIDSFLKSNGIKKKIQITMENTNTDARKAAAIKMAAFEIFTNGFSQIVQARNIFNAMEIFTIQNPTAMIIAAHDSSFNQSHPDTLDKGEVRDQAIEICDALNHAITCYHSNTFPAVEYLQKVLEKTKVIFIV